MYQFQGYMDLQSCRGEGTLISNNSTVEISPNVTRKSMMGSFGCPQPSKLDFLNQ